MLSIPINICPYGDHVVGIFLDFPKVFNTVNHSILLDDLCHHGIMDNALE